MQPASDEPREGSTALRRYGPIAAIVAVIAVIAAVVLLGGDDDDEAATAGPEPGEETEDTTDVTTADGGISYPLSFSAAEEADMVDDVEWGDRCDTERGQVAIPSYFAPECYAPFEGDNGGETDQGVTADAVKIVVYLGPDADPIINYITDAINVDDTNADTKSAMAGWVDMLETYTETYGREVQIEFYESQGIASDSTTARADAVRIAEEMKPFQVWGGPALTKAFGQELVARGIQCLNCGLTPTHEEALEADGMWLSGTALSNEQARRHNVEALVNQVAGGKAEYAGDESMQDQERVFGYLYIESSEDSVANAEAYRNELSERGVELAEVVPYSLDPATLQETAANAIAKLKQAGVTTVIFAGDPVAPRDFTREATAQDYYPEWFLNLSTLIDTNAFGRSYDQGQWANAFGLTPLAARVDPDVFSSYQLYEWFHGEETSADGTLEVIVPSPNLFFDVLQEAGPDLTHESFAAAIQRYSNPDAVHAYSVSFGDHGLWDGVEAPDWFGIDDVTKIWWDPEAEGQDEIRKDGKGLWMFVDGGKRYNVADWKEGDFGAFDPEGATGIYDDHPEGTTPPEYEPLPALRPSS